MTSPDTVPGLRDAFSGGLLTDAADIEPFLIDWRRTWRGIALAVAMPHTVEDVAAIVRWCTAHDVAIVPQGGNTGQTGGSVPRDHGRNIVLALTRLNRIRMIDPANDTITVDAGCILHTVQQAAAAADRLFPLSLGAEGSCTIGGTLATNAGGTAVLRYGNARDLCLGLEVVTATGEIWHGLRALRKDNSGYDLRDLFIGSEGTLGIITGAVLKLFPKPAARLTAFVAVQTPADAMALFARTRSRHAAALTAFELLSGACVALVRAQHPAWQAPLDTDSPWFVLIEISDPHSETAARAALEDGLASAIDERLISDGVIAGSIAQARTLWQWREAISSAQAATARAQGGTIIKHDIAVPLSGIAAFINDGLAAVTAAFPGIAPVIFGHLGDGNLHYNFTAAPGTDTDATRLTAIVHDLVRAHHGTIAAEHGLGVLRRDEADQARSPVERRLMAAIKTAFDPHNIMNPDKLIGGTT
jgi:FAD/FMN-containing dehydrogenase